MSAPFELLVAVVIMGFVVIIGTSLLGQIQMQVCKNNNDKEIEKFISNLHNTADYRSNSKFAFTLDKCFNENKATIGIQVEKASASSSANCNAVCGTPSERCHIMVFYTADIPDGLIRKCINIPEFTSFETNLGDPCPVVTEGGIPYTLVSPELTSIRPGSTIVNEGQPLLKSGTYIFKNVSTVGEETPRVCIYYRP